MTLRSRAAGALPPLAAVLCAAPLAAQEYFRAPQTGIIVRESPGGVAAGALEPGAGPIQPVETRLGWARFGLGERDVWVALDALTPAEPPLLPGAAGVPDGLLCTGVEPFWALTLGATTRLSTPDSEGEEHALNPEGAVPAAGAARFPARLDYGPITVALDLAACSDGMSDATQPWRALALTPGGLLQGCCRLPFDER